MNEKEIKIWHEKAFLHARAETQEKRVVDELLEYAQADEKEHKLEELADAYIAYIGLTRFCDKPHYLKEIYKAVDDSFCESDFKKMVADKMKINCNRYDTGYWFFEEKTGEYIAAHKLK